VALRYRIILMQHNIEFSTYPLHIAADFAGRTHPLVYTSRLRTYRLAPAAALTCFY